MTEIECAIKIFDGSQAICDSRNLRAAWQTVRTYVLAQTNNNARAEICPWCNGRGRRVGQFNEETCNVCGGTGKGKLSLGSVKTKNESEAL